jgi:hypothetical protein
MEGMIHGLSEDNPSTLLEIGTENILKILITYYQ